MLPFFQFPGQSGRTLVFLAASLVCVCLLQRALQAGVTRSVAWNKHQATLSEVSVPVPMKAMDGASQQMHSVLHGTNIKHSVALRHVFSFHFKGLSMAQHVGKASLLAMDVVVPEIYDWTGGERLHRLARAWAASRGTVLLRFNWPHRGEL
eukprot:229336-Amphidinium_carterae.2